MDRVWLITGASTGIGRGLALAVLERGERMAVTARDPGRLDPALRGSDRVLTLALEATDAAQCRAVVEQTIARFGRIDVLVNNAGHSMTGAVEEISDAEARLVFDVNVFGLLDVTRAALPHMRKARRGHVVNIGSVGGILARAGSGIYGATKFALEGISEALHQELKPLGIKVTVVEPGPFRTEFAGTSYHEARQTIADYDATAGAWRKALRGKHGTQVGDPDKAGKAILAVIDAPEPPLHFVLGAEAMARASDKIRALQAEIERWRSVSEPTEYDA